MIRLWIGNVLDKPTIAMGALAHSDYLLLNEARDRVLSWARKRTRNHGGPVFQVGMFASGQNVHVYRQRSVGVVARGQRVLLTGGRRGLGKSPRDRRRRGPTRTAAWQLVFTRDDKRLLILVDLHLIARSTTSERWRRPLMLLSLARLRVLHRQLQLRFPGVPIVTAGDGNLPTLNQWKLGKDWRVIATPPDFGHRHYTQLYVYGDVRVEHVREQHNASDHDAIACTLILGDGVPRLAS